MIKTYTEYLGLKRLSTASTVMSLKNQFMVNISDIKDKILRELKNTCDGEHEGLKVGLTTRKLSVNQDK